MTIHKFQIEFTGELIQIPGFVKVVSITTQRDDLVLYAIVDDLDKRITTIEVCILGTGNPLDAKVLLDEWVFTGTHSQYAGGLMWHVWYKERK